MRTARGRPRSISFLIRLTSHFSCFLYFSQVPILGARHRERLKGVGLFLASKRATKSLSALVRAATHDPARAAALTRLGEAGGGLGVNGRLAAQAARHMWKFPI